MGRPVLTYCQNCRQKSLRKAPIPCFREGLPRDSPPLAHTHACGACGESYLSLVYAEPDGARVEQWHYYPEEEPALRRTARYQEIGPFGEQALAATEFYLGERRTSESAWRAALARRRQPLPHLLPAERGQTGAALGMTA